MFGNNTRTVSTEKKSEKSNENVDKSPARKTELIFSIWEWEENETKSDFRAR